MTRNQILYHEVQEKIRANKAKEALTDYANQTSRSDVQKRFDVGSEANVIQARNVANQLMLGNRQQTSNERQAGAAESQAKTAETRAYNDFLKAQASIKSADASMLSAEAQTALNAIRQQEANIKQFESEIKDKERMIKNVEAMTNARRATDYGKSVDAQMITAEANAKKADTDLKRLNQDMDKFIKKYNQDVDFFVRNYYLADKDLDSKIEQRNIQNVKAFSDVFYAPLRSTSLTGIAQGVVPFN